MGEFEEQIFRNKVFSGEIRPSDWYWIPGFSDWRPVSEFRVARKTEVIVLDDGSAVVEAAEIVKASHMERSDENLRHSHASFCACHHLASPLRIPAHVDLSELGKPEIFKDEEQSH